MTREFVDHCLAFAAELLDAIGTFVFQLAMKDGDPDIGPPPPWLRNLKLTGFSARRQRVAIARS